VNRTIRYIAVILELSALLTAGISLAQQSQSEDTEKALRAQADRARVIYERGRAAHYTQKFDLSGMPHYVPKQQLTGWIRLHGNNYLSDGMLGELWQQGFAKYQPGIRISYFLPRRRWLLPRSTTTRPIWSWATDRAFTICWRMSG